MKHDGWKDGRRDGRKEGIGLQWVSNNLLAKGVQSKLEKDIVHIDNGTRVGHLVKVVAHRL